MEQTLQYIQIATGIIEIILFISFIILVFVLIKIIKNLSIKIDNFQTVFLTKIDPVVNNAKTISSNINDLVGKVNENIDTLKDTVDKVKGGTEEIVDKFRATTDSIIQFEQKIQRRIEPEVFDTVNRIVAISKGIKKFFEKFSNRNGKYDSSQNYEYYDGELDDELSDINKKLDDIKRKIDS